MADLQRIESRQVTAPIDANIVPSGNLQNQVAAQGANQMSTAAQTLADQTITFLGADEAQKGRQDAAQIIDRDGNGKLTPPSSFTPAGFQSRAYATSYQQQAEALYSTALMQDANAHAQQLGAKYPTDSAKVAEEMKKYSDDLLSTHSPELAPFLKVRLSGVSAQAVSVALNNQTVEDNKALQEKLSWSFNSYVENTSQRAKAVLGMSAEDAAASKLLDNAELEDFVKLARMAGASESKITNMVHKAKAGAVTATIVKELESRSYLQPILHQAGDKQGQPITNEYGVPIQAFSYEGILEAKRYGEEQAKKYPQFANEIRSAVSTAVATGGQNSQLALSAQDQKVKNAALADQVAVMSITQPLPSNVPADVALVVSQAKQIKLEEMRMGIYSDKTASPVEILSRLAVVDQAEGVVSKATSGYAQDALMTNASVLRSLPGEYTPQQIQYAQQDQSRLLNQLRAMRHVVPPSIVQFAENSVREYAARDMKADVFQQLHDVSTGVMDEVSVQNLATRLYKDGWVGNIVTPEQVSHAMQQGSIARGKLRAQNANAIYHHERWAQGIPQTPAQAKANAETDPFSRYIGGQTFSGTAEQFDVAFQRLAQTGGVPYEVTEFLNTTYGRTTDPALVGNAQKFFRDVEGLLSKRPGIDSNLASIHTTNLLGEAGNQIFQTLGLSPEETITQRQKGGSTSFTGQAGASPPEMNSKLDDAFEVTMSNMNVDNSRSLVGSWFNPSPEFNISNAPQPGTLYGNTTTPEDDEGLLGKLKAGIFGREKTQIVADPQLKAAIMTSAARHVSVHNKNDKLHEIDTYKRAIAMKIDSYRDFTEVVPDPNNPGQSIFRLMTGPALVQKMVGLSQPATKEQVSAYVQGMIENAVGKSHNMPILFDFQSGRMETRLSGSGEPVIAVGYKSNGHHITFAEMSARDPALTGYGQSIAQAVSEQKRKATAPLEVPADVANTRRLNKEAVREPFFATAPSPGIGPTAPTLAENFREIGFSVQETFQSLKATGLGIMDTWLGDGVKQSILNQEADRLAGPGNPEENKVRGDQRDAVARRAAEIERERAEGSKPTQQNEFQLILKGIRDAALRAYP